MNRILKLIFIAFLMLTSIQAVSSAAKPLVVVVATGGTIAQKADPKTGALVPAVSGEGLVRAVPGLSKLARIKVRQFCNIDSSHMTPRMWAKLSRTVDKILSDPGVAAVVITHGTDTMAEGAFFLDVTLKAKKPVVFVGSMRGANEPSADGPANLLDAVTQAVSPAAKGWGVTVTLNQYISAARWVEKTRTSNVQTFSCGDHGYLGVIRQGNVRRFGNGPPAMKLALPEKMAQVSLVTSFAGDDGSLIRAAVEKGDNGIVVEALGAGNLGPGAAKAVAEALKKGIVVVIASRVPWGGAFAGYGDFGGGGWLRQKGAIISGGLSGPKARLVLMLALPQIKDPKALDALFG